MTKPLAGGVVQFARNGQVPTSWRSCRSRSIYRGATSGDGSNKRTRDLLGTVALLAVLVGCWLVAGYVWVVHCCCWCADEK
jgi:hypothetical protein